MQLAFDGLRLVAQSGVLGKQLLLLGGPVALELVVLGKHAAHVFVQLLEFLLSHGVGLAHDVLRLHVDVVLLGFDVHLFALEHLLDFELLQLLLLFMRLGFKRLDLLSQLFVFEFRLLVRLLVPSDDQVGLRQLLLQLDLVSQRQLSLKLRVQHVRRPTLLAPVGGELLAEVVDFGLQLLDLVFGVFGEAEFFVGEFKFVDLLREVVDFVVLFVQLVGRLLHTDLVLLFEVKQLALFALAPTKEDALLLTAQVAFKLSFAQHERVLFLARLRVGQVNLLDELFRFDTVQVDAVL